MSLRTGNFKVGDAIVWDMAQAGADVQRTRYGEGPFIVESVSGSRGEIVRMTVSASSATPADGHGPRLRSFFAQWFALAPIPPDVLHAANVADLLDVLARWNP